MNTTTSNVYYSEEEEFMARWGEPIWNLDPELMPWRLMIIIWVLTAMSIGVPGNIMTIALILFEKKLRQLHHVFFVNLALCDFGVMVMDMFVLLGAIYGKEFYTSRPLLCEFSGFVCMISCFGSLWSMMFIALNRYTCVLHKNHYDKIFGIKGTIWCIIILWSCVILMDLPNWSFLGIGSHAYFDFAMHCAFSRTSSLVYNTVMYTGLAVLLPALVILYCYISILMRTSKSAEKVSMGNSGLSKKRKSEQKQLTISLMTIYALFSVTWLPTGVLIFMFGVGKVDVFAAIPFWQLLIIELWTHTNSAINSIILGATHSGFKKVYLSLFERLISGCKDADDDQSGVTK